MRKAFRIRSNKDYWDRRWAEAGKDEDYFRNLDIYPIKYAQMVTPHKEGLMVELGCGLGRVVKHYHRQGIPIIGIERSQVAVEQIMKDQSGVTCLQGDVMRLPFGDQVFDSVLAFGLYHNFEDNWQEAINETVRCMKKGGKFVISVRPNNFEMRFNEFYWNLKQKSDKQPSGKKFFHKSLFEENEFQDILERSGLSVEHLFRAKNVSMFWRIPFLRHASGDENEGQRRAGGYRLNAAGRWLDRQATRFFPSSFCNVLVYIGKRLK